MERLRIVASSLKSLIKQVDYARSKDGTRPHIHGINFAKKGMDIVVTATDGHRLAQTNIVGYYKAIGDTWSLTLPGPILALISCIKDDHCVILSEDQDHNKINLLAIAGKTIELDLSWAPNRFAGNGAEFPPVDQVIPNYFQSEQTVQVGQLKTAINKIQKQFKALDDVGVGNTYIQLDRNNLQVGIHGIENPEELKSQGAIINQDITRVYLDLKYLYETIRDAFMKNESVTLQINGQLDPIGVRDSDRNLRCIIMPYQVPR